MKRFTDWMNEGIVKDNEMYGYKMTKQLKMADGTLMSIQASDGHYCTPRRYLKNYNGYWEFEIGFPTKKIDCLMPYSEDSENPTDTVYGYVPFEIIQEAIESCGGVVGFRDEKE